MTLSHLTLAPAAFAVLVCGLNLSAVALDPTFGNNGVVTATLDAGAEGRAVGIQSDGKIVVAGSKRSADYVWVFALMRFAADGSLDTTFGDGGKVVTEFPGPTSEATCVLVQADGKIVAAGYALDPNYGQSADTYYSRVALARYNTDGSLDSTFGEGGKVTTAFNHSTEAVGLVEQRDGKIILGAPGILLRYNSDGSLDSGFGNGGKVSTAIGWSAFALQSDGKFVVGGTIYRPWGIYGDTDFMVARFDADGSLDTTFGDGGRVVTDLGSFNDTCNCVTLQTDGKIVAAGYSASPPEYEDPSLQDFAVVRYNSDGSLDSSFGDGGKTITPISEKSDHSVVTDEALAVAIQADGKIVLAGFSRFPGDGENEEANNDFALVRYNADGSLDTGFGTGGKVTTEINWEDTASGIALQSDGSIVLAGISRAYGDHASFAVARYLTDEPSLLAAQDDIALAGTDSVLIDVLANDAAIDGGALVLVSVTQPDSGGTAVIEEGMIRFTPSAEVVAPITFSYVMKRRLETESGQVTVLPLAEAVGRYSGLVRRGDFVRGKLSASVTARGMATGTLRMDGSVYRFKGKVAGLHTMKAFAGAGRTPVRLRLGAGTADLSGRPTLRAVAIGRTAVGVAEKCPFDIRHPAPQAGRYTAAFTQPPGGVASAAGAVARFNITTRGTVRLAGRFGLGGPVTQGGSLLTGGRFPLYEGSGRGSAVRRQSGVLAIDPTKAPAISGSIRWSIPPLLDDRFRWA